MDRIFLNVANARCYVGHAFKFSKDTEEHVINLETIFTILKNNGLRLRIKKCYFIQPSAELLGRIVDKNGVHVDEQKVEKRRDAIPPTTRKELR